MNVSVEEEHKKWLQQHPDINASALMRNSIELKMRQEDNVSPLLFMSTIAAIVLSVTILLISTIPVFSLYIRLILYLLAGFMSLSATIVYLKERKAIKKVEAND